MPADSHSDQNGPRGGHTDPPAVLVIEDHDDTREMVALFLSAHGVPVVTAPNAHEGLRRARETRPALILLDLMMPGISGEQFRQMQLLNASIAAIPVVVMSARPDAAAIASRMGAVACVPKPIDWDSVLSAIQTYGSH